MGVILEEGVRVFEARIRVGGISCDVKRGWETARKGGAASCP